MREIADCVCAGLLSECATGPSDSQIEHSRQRAREAGNPLKVPIRDYPIKVILLSGLALSLRVMFCQSDKHHRASGASSVPKNAPEIRWNAAIAAVAECASN